MTLLIVILWTQLTNKNTYEDQNDLLHRHLRCVCNFDTFEILPTLTQWYLVNSNVVVGTLEIVRLIKTGPPCLGISGPQAKNTIHLNLIYWDFEIFGTLQ